MGFPSGPHLVDIALLALGAEAIGMTIVWRRTRRGIAPHRLLPNLAAGFFLLLSLRLALGQYDWPWYAACLAAAGVANVADLRQRWR